MFQCNREENDGRICVKHDWKMISKLDQLSSRILHHTLCYETICKPYWKEEISSMKKKRLFINPAARISSSVVKYLNIERSVSSGNWNINASCSIYSSRSSFLRFLRVLNDIEGNRSKDTIEFLLYEQGHYSIKMKFQLSNEKYSINLFFVIIYDDAISHRNKIFGKLNLINNYYIHPEEILQIFYLIKQTCVYIKKDHS